MSAVRADELPFDRGLLERWRPALHYDPQEPYRAISARSMTDHEGNVLVLGDGTVLARAGGAGAGRLTLELLGDYPGALRPSEDDRLDAAPDELAAARRFQSDPRYANRAYGRVARHGGYTWLQYWLWFYYNPKHLLGAGRHEGDWELVQVGLGPGGTPELVTCSQHQTGEGRSWDEVRRRAHADGDHPLIYVAPFSHACYFEEGAHPFCIGIDNPDGSRPPLVPEIEQLGDWRAWPGRWGDSEGVLAPLHLGALGGRSPRSPARQGARWDQPLAYHREGERTGSWRRQAGRAMRLVGTATHPKLVGISARLSDRTAVIDYELDRSPLRSATELYVTVHRPPPAAAPPGALGEVLLSQAKAIEACEGAVQLLLLEDIDRCVVVASAFNRVRQRSEPLRTSARQAAGGGGPLRSHDAMARAVVQFEYATGVPRSPLRAATLVGSWDDAGRPSGGPWTARPMRRGTAADGSDAFLAEVELDAAAVGRDFAWGVLVDLGGDQPAWGIAAEVHDLGATAQERTFTLRAAGGRPQRESYRLSHHRRLGARPLAAPDGAPRPLRFSVWAPNAQAVEVVFGGASGYIADDGQGIDSALPALAMHRDAEGVWSVDGGDFEASLGRAYMYRVTTDDGRVVYRTDMYSLAQSGFGDVDPGGRPFHGDVAQLDGTPSCSVVIDPDVVEPYPPGTEAADQPAEAFWADELDPQRPVPRRVADLVIYELHVGALAPHTDATGTFADALALLPYLEDLGVNAVELLPMLEFNGSLSWGYGASHLLAIEKSAGGRSALKHFVKACHQRGIAVLMDVVYNHYTEDAARAAWQYDSVDDERNIYYWYEGPASRYRDPRGGYIDNVSSGWAPRYHDAHVRDLIVSSAVMLLDEFHLDGLRVDQTTSIHSYNALHADGTPVAAANIFGRKLLRALCQTLQTIAPDCMLIAEDHSHWDAVTQPAARGGIGFNAVWEVDFYHHLIGDKNEGPEYARLLHTAARDHEGPLNMSAFARALAASTKPSVVYAESHDEAGGAEHSARTIVVAAGGAPLVGATRTAAEARCRLAAGMTLLSAGTPMFLMGEEVGAQKRYTYNHFFEEKEDLLALRATGGAGLFAFHADLIALRLGTPALRSRHLEIVHCHDANRVIAFRRWDDTDEYLIVGSLHEHHYDNPDYRIAHRALGDAPWRECFNSNATAYGGDGTGNGPDPRRAANGTLGVVIPAMGLVVLHRL